MKLLKDNTGEYLDDLGCGDTFSDVTPQIHEKNNW